MTLEDKDIVQINATIIVGVLIFLTLNISLRRTQCIEVNPTLNFTRQCLTSKNINEIIGENPGRNFSLSVPEGFGIPDIQLSVFSAAFAVLPFIISSILTLWGHISLGKWSMIAGFMVLGVIIWTLVLAAQVLKRRTLHFFYIACRYPLVLFTSVLQRFNYGLVL